MGLTDNVQYKSLDLQTCNFQEIFTGYSRDALKGDLLKFLLLRSEKYSATFNKRVIV